MEVTKVIKSLAFAKKGEHRRIGLPKWRTIALILLVPAKDKYDRIEKHLGDRYVRKGRMLECG
jgi:hypothetical protein